MDKNKQIVSLCYLVAIVVFVAIVYVMVSTSFEEYKNISDSQSAVNAEFQSYKSQYEQSKEKKAKDEIQLQSIKPVYETSENSTNENLGVFGTMFEDIIKKAQYNGLMVRSIEYDMRPSDDALYNGFSDLYNVCELKFFFVGTYAQLRTFLNEMVNDFKNLVSISRLNVTAFNGNTDYLLINMSITLYSKKPAANSNSRKAKTAAANEV